MAADIENIKLENKKQRTYNTVVDENYDPYEHRDVDNPTTNCETLVHILKGSLGTGILAMPQAFHHSGYVNGIIFTIIIGILCTYCMHLLIRMKNIVCKRHQLPNLTYPQSMKLALQDGPVCLRWLTPVAVGIVDGFLIVYQLGICCVYVVFVAENIRQVCGVYLPPMDIKIWMCILFLPFLILSFVRDLKKLAPFCTFANVLTFVGITFVLYYVLRDPWTMEDKDLIGPVDGFPLFFGTVLFALEAVGVIIALEQNMKTPRSFGGTCGVFNIGMSIIIFLYAGLGLLGYLRYGKDSLGSITLNLPLEEWPAQVTKIIFAIALFISFALQGYVPVEIIWHTYVKNSVQNTGRLIFYEYLLRFLIVVCIFLLAIAIPRLGLFISLFGALCLSVLGFVFPALMELCVYWPDKLGPFKYILIKDILISILGFTGLVCGTYVSVRDIVRSFQ